MYFSNKSPVILLLLSLLIISSCAELKINPPSPKNQTLLVLPVEVTNTAQYRRHSFYYVYEIKHVAGEVAPYEATIKLPLKGDMLIIDSLPPGDYFVDKFTFLPEGSGDFTYGKNVEQRHDKFRLESGSITIFSQSLNVRLFNRTVGHGPETSYTMQMVPVTKVQEQKVLATLKELQNFDTWDMLSIKE